MNYFDSNLQGEELSLNNLKLQKMINKESYNIYLKNVFSNDLKSKIRFTDYEHLENAFTNEIYYRAMKDLSTKEKQILGYLILDENSIEEVSKKMQLTKAEIIELKYNAINKFKELTKKYSKLFSSQKGGGNSEE